MIQYLLLIIVLLIFTYVGYQAYQKRSEKRAIKNPQFRVLLAVRKSQAGALTFLRMNENERDDFLDSLQNQWNAFNARISAFGFFIGGFESTHAGLKSDVGEDWQILGFYDFQNYDDFSRCTAILDDPQFLSLRNYCDIRMLFGEKKSSFSNTITELF